jgi:hypothetical protein
MIIPANYGFSTRSSMSYYFTGLTANYQKFGVAGAIVEAAWMAGLQANFSQPLSNLGRRPVDVYSNVKNSNRFAPPSVGALANLPQWSGKRATLAPTSAGWTIWT